MNEQCYAIGDTPQLVGVYTSSKQPQGTNDKPSMPTILFINSGLVSRIGPFRHYVRLAREFSNEGFNSFRFDLSGIGDSERRNDNLNFNEQALADIQQVMNYLDSKHNDKRYVIFGICTGADNAHKAMVKFDKIVGAITVDGYCYPTIKYLLQLYGKKLISASSWLTLIKMPLDMVKSFFKSEEAKIKLGSYDYNWILQKKNKTADDYRYFVKKNAFLLSIFTATWPYSYQEQLADSFPKINFGDNIEVAYFENAEHTFPLLEDRNEVTAKVVNWLNRHFKDN